jgi:hypothetical protein
VGSHMLQHVGCRLNRALAHLVHADRVPAVLANHGSTPCDGSSPDVHASRLRSIAGRAEGIGTATTDFGCCESHYRREARKGYSTLRAAISGSRNLQISSSSALFV